MKVVVVGAGVMGMMTARELARAGCSVTLLEKSAVGQEASWAGGGIVSPLYPWRYSPPVTALATQAQEAYPELAQELLAETGIDPELFPCGLLMLDAEDSRDALSWARQQGKEIQCLDQADLQAYFEGLSTHWQQGLLMPALCNIRNPRLLKALHASLLLSGVALHEHADVLQWKQEQGRVVAAITQRQSVEADAFVICGGAWSPGLLAAASRYMLPVRPVRGQMIIYRLAPGEIPCMIMAGGRYLIPRRDGHVLCGSTLEESGYDKSVTEAARHELMASAALLWPALADKEPIAHWAGLRPGSPNGIPFIGRVPGCENLWVNAGHHRNGLVLAPASARLLADQLLQREPLLDVRPYQL